MTACTSCGSEPTVAKGLCSRCYRQHMRGRPTGPRKSTMGETHMVQMRWPLELVQRASKAAKQAGLTLSAWVRQLVEKALHTSDR